MPALRMQGEGSNLQGSCKDSAPEVRTINSDVTPLELDRAFNKMDASRSGKISKKDISGMLDDLGYSSKEKNCVIDTLDVDGDGAVSKEEFLRACESDDSDAVCDVKIETTKEMDVSDKAIICEFYQRLVSFRRKQKGEHPARPCSSASFPLVLLGHLSFSLPPLLPLLSRLPLSHFSHPLFSSPPRPLLLQPPLSSSTCNGCNERGGICR